MKFNGDLEELQRRVLLAGLLGTWEQLGAQHHRFTTLAGDILNFWTSTKTINFQGEDPESFKAFFLRFVASPPPRSGSS